MTLIILTLLLLSFITYYISLKKFRNQNKIKENNKQLNYFAYYISLWAFLPALSIVIISYILNKIYLDYYIFGFNNTDYSPLIKETLKSQIMNLSSSIYSGRKIEDVFISGVIPLNQMLIYAKNYIYYNNLLYVSSFLLGIFSFIILSFIALKRIQYKQNFQYKIEKLIKSILFIFTLVAVLTTIGIIFSLLFEALKFFQHVSIINFLFGINWSPEQAEINPEGSFGVIPLLSGTLLIAFISVSIAIILGISSAVYMSEYMPKRIRKIIKPTLEILAGIPSIVYGFFAAIIVSPLMVSFFRVFGLDISSENALTTGLVMGIMLIPFISSITDDMLHAVPKSMREGAMGMGSLKNEMIRYVVIPAAFPGIMASVLLAISRAIGETMIVVMASSLAANLTLNPLEPVTTITTQMVMLVQGDQEFNDPRTLVVFALGLLLLVLTLILNIIAIRIVNKYKEQYD
jgi:phosphate transport system permease protein